jgi:uroporphyrinogen-III decarboxylase
MKKAQTGVPDRVPVYAQMANHSARLAGESTYDFFTNAEIFLKCELFADEFYGFDAPTINYDCYNIEAEALGARLLLNEDEVPEVGPTKPLLSSLDNYTKLKVPKPGKGGRMPYVLEINDRLINMGLAPKIRFCGIFTLVCKIMGYENLIASIGSDPGKIHKLMLFLTDEVLAPWIMCQREKAGVNATATGSEAFASPPLVTLNILEEFCIKYFKRLEEQVGGIRLAGVWGESVIKDPEKLLDIKRDGSKGMIQACDPDVSVLGPAFYKRYADKNDVGLIMGLDAGLIKYGPVPEIRARAHRYMSEAGGEGRFVLFINDIPYDTSPENVHTVVFAARDHQYML